MHVHITRLDPWPSSSWALRTAGELYAQVHTPFRTAGQTIYACDESDQTPGQMAGRGSIDSKGTTLRYKCLKIENIQFHLFYHGRARACISDIPVFNRRAMYRSLAIPTQRVGMSRPRRNIRSNHAKWRMTMMYQGYGPLRLHSGRTGSLAQRHCSVYTGDTCVLLPGRPTACRALLASASKSCSKAWHDADCSASLRVKGSVVTHALISAPRPTLARLGLTQCWRRGTGRHRDLTSAILIFKTAQGVTHGRSQRLSRESHPYPSTSLVGPAEAHRPWDSPEAYKVVERQIGPMPIPFLFHPLD